MAGKLGTYPISTELIYSLVFHTISAPQEKNDDGPQQVVLGQCGYVPQHVYQVVLEECQRR